MRATDAGIAGKASDYDCLSLSGLPAQNRGALRRCALLSRESDQHRRAGQALQTCVCRGQRRRDVFLSELRFDGFPQARKTTRPCRGCCRRDCRSGLSGAHMVGVGAIQAPLDRHPRRCAAFPSRRPDGLALPASRHSARLSRPHEWACDLEQALVRLLVGGDFGLNIIEGAALPGFQSEDGSEGKGAGACRDSTSILRPRETASGLGCWGGRVQCTGARPAQAQIGFVRRQHRHDTDRE